MSILEIEEECGEKAQSKYYCWYNLHISEGQLLLKSPQTTGMGEVSLGENISQDSSLDILRKSQDDRRGVPLR